MNQVWRHQQHFHLERFAGNSNVADNPPTKPLALQRPSLSREYDSDSNTAPENGLLPTLPRDSPSVPNEELRNRPEAANPPSTKPLAPQHPVLPSLCDSEGITAPVEGLVAKLPRDSPSILNEELQGGTHPTDPTPAKPFCPQHPIFACECDSDSSTAPDCLLSNVPQNYPSTPKDQLKACPITADPPPAKQLSPEHPSFPSEYGSDSNTAPQDDLLSRLLQALPSVPMDQLQARLNTTDPPMKPHSPQHPSLPRKYDSGSSTYADGLVSNGPHDFLNNRLQTTPATPTTANLPSTRPLAPQREDSILFLKFPQDFPLIPTEELQGCSHTAAPSPAKPLPPQCPSRPSKRKYGVGDNTAPGGSLVSKLPHDFPLIPKEKYTSLPDEVKYIIRRQQCFHLEHFAGNGNAANPPSTKLLTLQRFILARQYDRESMNAPELDETFKRALSFFLVVLLLAESMNAPELDETFKRALHGFK